jgi:hypothetical protein
MDRYDMKHAVLVLPSHPLELALKTSKATTLQQYFNAGIFRA